MLLLIDNYDSFTYNLVQYLSELGAEVAVRRNDLIALEEIAALEPERIVLSPGPCAPAQAGICVAAVQAFGPRIPTLGVCLGHQSIGAAFGGQVVRARRVMHGKTSMIRHDGQGLFRGLADPLKATRYHSLIVARETLPDCLQITAWTERDGAFDEIMGFRHRQYPIEGVQFHPESIFTETGRELLRNFLEG